MDLVSRLLHALASKPAHPTEFERCACALLASRYPGLSAVEGGHDFGRDADIYFPFGDADSASHGRLLATTGDPSTNLRPGLRRMQEESVAVNLVVIACLQPVSARTRATLDGICAEFGLDPPHVCAQDWLVAKLVHEPAWRQRLLDVGGELGALLDRPLEMIEQTTAVPKLVGRDTELSTLQQMVAAGGDVVVTGARRAWARLGCRRSLMDRWRSLSTRSRAVSSIICYWSAQRSSSLMTPTIAWKSCGSFDAHAFKRSWIAVRVAVWVEAVAIDDLDAHPVPYKPSVNAASRSSLNPRQPARRSPSNPYPRRPMSRHCS